MYPIFEFLPRRGTDRLDFAAGDLFSGAAGGLGSEVVWTAVDDHRAPDDVPDAETVGIHGQIGPAVTGEQGRKVAAVVGVGAAAQIEVAAGIGKAGTGAPGPIVAVKAEDGRGAGPLPLGEAGDVGGHQYAAAKGKEGHCPGDSGRGAASADTGDRRGTAKG